jgi:transcriptional regulator GlxA family with amidase domain
MVLGMLGNVAVLVLDGVDPFELGVLCEVFGTDRSADGLPSHDFAVCGLTPGRVRTKTGFGLELEHGLDRLAAADLVAVPAAADVTDPPAAVLEALRATVARGARVMSVCSGAFALAAAGLLDDRRATTHWMATAELAARFPRVQVDPNVLYVDADPVFTSAGSAAGIDLCLHLLRREHGAAVANMVARRMVVPPHREGGQAQYVAMPLPSPRLEDDRLAQLLDWITAHLADSHTVESLAAHALMSPRTFARRFRAATGTTPAHWLVGQRLLLVQRLLEQTDEPVETIADRSGFHSAALLRQHFARRIGTTPQGYRRTFRGQVA